MLKVNEISKESFLYNQEENQFDEEDNFDEINNQYKESSEDLNDSNLKEKLIIKFNPKVVYKKCLDKKIIGEKYNLTYKFVKNETKLLRKILEGHGFEQVHSSSSQFNLMWTATSIKPLTFKSLYPFQRVNHFPKSSELTRKDRLYKNIEKMQQEKGFKHFDFIPTTFVLPQEYYQFKSIFEKEKGIWIVKPIASSQGKGIYLINNIDDLSKDENIVVSRYIDNPLLIDGYKFDIRLYVAITSYHPLIIYLYEEGLVRFATIKYDRNTENISNSFMHLTNYSLNKLNHRYIRCDDAEIEDYGNKWTMSAMLRLLKSEGKDTFSLMMSIEDLIIKTFISVESQISDACQIFVPNKSNCFEVYGFDILVDDQLKAWLIEVNLSPSLTCDAPIDLKVKSHMICDLLNLISLPCINIYNYLNKQKQPNKQSIEISGFMSESLNSGIKLNENGLSIEQIRLLKKLEEENIERGGFIRIFPNEDTYEFFSYFFRERKICLNKIVHQYFYPTRWKKTNFNFEENFKQIRRNNISRSKHLSSAYHLFNKNQINNSNLLNAIQRFNSYQKRLIQNIYSSNKTNIIYPQKILIEKSIIEQDNFSSFSSSSSNILLVPPQTRRTTPINSHRTILSTKKIKHQSFKLNENENENENDLNEHKVKRPLLRVSSAPKREYQRKTNEISRLDRSSRPISTIVQHRKRMSTRLSSSSSNKRLSSDEQIDVFNNQDLNKDFVDKLNELSTKQHRRQYSGFNHNHNLPLEIENLSISIESQINLQEKNKENQEKVLEKTREILEKNQIKNEELAKQAKLFQEKFQKNEIYSALNRYSHRPPMYPTSSNKSSQQQIRNNKRISIFLDQHQIKS